MKLMVSVSFLMAFLCIGIMANAQTDICYTDGTVLKCTADSNYPTWRVGKHTTTNYIYACAYVSGVWVKIGDEQYLNHTAFVVYGLNDSSTPDQIKISSSTAGVICDSSAGSYIEKIPSGWFTTVTIYGRDGNDYLEGSYLNENIYGDAGNDTLYGNNGDDTLDGRADNDEIHGGNGNDDLYGGSGDDILYGDANDDYLLGGDDDDDCYGGANSDDCICETEDLECDD